MNKHMQKFIACLLLGLLLGMIPPLLPAQQNQSAQQSDPEIEALKKRISELEKQLQTVRNLEKMELQAKLADANAKLADANTKLINADFGTFKNELRIDNEERMRGWSYWFFGILVAIAAISGAAIVFWLKSLIADRVEKNLNGFKEAVAEQNIIKNELRVLEEQYTVSVLEDFIGHFLGDEYHQPEQIKALRDETLLQILGAEGYRLELKYKVAEALVAKKSPQLVSPLLELLNSVVDSDSEIYFGTNSPEDGVKFLEQIATLEAYQGLKRFLNRLLTKNPKRKDWFLRETVSSLVNVSVGLNMGDSVPLLKMAIPHLKDLEPADLDCLGNLARYFDIFNDPAGIKDILDHHVTGEIPGSELAHKRLEDRCLELLQKHDPEFVKEWRAKRTTTNSNT